MFPTANCDRPLFSRFFIIIFFLSGFRDSWWLLLLLFYLVCVCTRERVCTHSFAYKSSRSFLSRALQLSLSLFLSPLLWKSLPRYIIIITYTFTPHANNYRGNFDRYEFPLFFLVFFLSYISVICVCVCPDNHPSSLPFIIVITHLYDIFIPS